MDETQQGKGRVIGLLVVMLLAIIAAAVIIGLSLGGVFEVSPEVNPPSLTGPATGTNYKSFNPPVKPKEPLKFARAQRPRPPKVAPGVANNRAAINTGLDSGFNKLAGVQKVGNLVKEVRTPKKIGSVMKIPRSDSVKGRLFSFNPDGSMKELLTTIPQGVLDLARFKEGMLVLLDQGDLVYISPDEEDKLVEYQLPGTVNISSLTTYQDEVYGLNSEGQIYKFVFFNEDNYDWERVTDIPPNVIYMNSTNDGENLWIQNNEGRGILYDESLDVIQNSPVNPEEIRIYGDDVSSFIQINRNTRTAVLTQPDQEPVVLKDIHSGTFHNGKFVSNKYQQHANGIKMVKSLNGDHLYYIVFK
jgi:hypothetical protein